MARNAFPVADPLKIGSGNALSAAEGGLPSPRSNYFGGLYDIAGALDQYAAGIQRQDDVAEGFRVSEAADKYALDLATRVGELDPTSETYTKDVQTAVTDLTRNTLEGTKLKGSHRQMQLKDQLSGQSTRALVQSIGARQGALQEQAVNRFTEGANAAANQMMLNPGNWDQIKGDFLSRVAPAMDAIPGQDREKLVHGFLNSAVLATAMGISDTKDFAGAREFLTSNAGSIDPDSVRNTIAQIDNRERQDINDKKAAIAEAKAAAKERAAAAEDAAENAALRGGTGDLSDIPTGYYAEHPEEAQLLREIEANRQDLTKAQHTAHAEAITDYAAGNDITPTQAEIVQDLLFKRQVKANLEAGMPEGQAQTQALATVSTQMLRQASTVAPAVAARISQMSRSSKPEDLGNAAFLDDQLRHSAGWTTELDTGLTDRAKTIRELTRSRFGGEPTAEHYALVAAELQNVTSADIDKRTKTAGELEGGTLDDFKKATGKTDPAAFREWKELRKTHFIFTGDVSVASQLATGEVTRSFNTTRVGGVPVEVRGPVPEQSYPAALRNGLDLSKIITDDVVTSVEGLGVSLPTAKAGEARVWLPPDEETKRLAKAGQSPSWPVMVPDKDRPSFFKPLIVKDGDTFRPVRWSGPKDQAAAYAEPGISRALQQKRDAIGAVSYDSAGNVIDPVARRRAEADAQAEAFLKSQNLDTPDTSTAKAKEELQGDAIKAADPMGNYGGP